MSHYEHSTTSSLTPGSPPSIHESTDSMPTPTAASPRASDAIPPPPPLSPREVGAAALAGAHDTGAAALASAQQAGAATLAGAHEAGAAAVASAQDAAAAARASAHDAGASALASAYDAGAAARSQAQDVSTAALATAYDAGAAARARAQDVTATALASGAAALVAAQDASAAALASGAAALASAERAAAQRADSAISAVTHNAAVQRADSALAALAAGPSNVPALTPGEPLTPGRLRDALVADAHRRVAASSPVQAAHAGFAAALHGGVPTFSAPPPPAGSPPPLDVGAYREALTADAHRRIAGAAPVQALHGVLAGLAAGPSSQPAPPAVPEKTGVWSSMAGAVRDTLVHEGHRALSGNVHVQDASARLGTFMGPGVARTTSPAPMGGERGQLGLPSRLSYLPARQPSDRGVASPGAPPMPLPIPTAVYAEERDAPQRRRGSRMSSMRRSGLDWVVPISEEGGSDGDRTVRMSGIHFPTERGSLAVRLAPTLLHAREQQAKLKMVAYYTGLAVNIAIGLQVLFGALTTGLAAAVPGRKAGLITSIFGGILTLLASYLARVRGSGEPERSKERAKDFANFIRDANAAILDRGWLVEKRRPGETEQEEKDDIDREVDYFRHRFEELMNAGTDKAQRKEGNPANAVA